MKKVFVYIDGFNLYYGALKNTPYKWLDLVALCRTMLPQYDIAGVKYFTARVRDTRSNPFKSQHQQIYLRALATFDEIEIIYGHFLHGTKLSLPADSPERKHIRVLHTEEKRSDVNLATHLIHDAHLRRFDAAAVITNDTDFLLPIELVQSHFGIPVGVLCSQKRPSGTLVQSAKFIKKIRPAALRACQLPDVLSDSKGKIRKPNKF